MAERCLRQYAIEGELVESLGLYAHLMIHERLRHYGFAPPTGTWQVLGPTEQHDLYLFRYIDASLPVVGPGDSIETVVVTRKQLGFD